MRISSQASSTDMTASVSSANQNIASTNTATNAQRQATQQASKPKVVDRPTITEATNAQAAEGISKTAENKEKLQDAVDSLNEFMKEHMPAPTASKFRLHEGLDRYYVQVVDAQTDEVVKEIPPEKLLNAFYEMQKLVGMIVDEKI
ncbi:flagellar protein FlaG [Lysinibacillus alkalisoli]|uniref:Flagellar protein FlaG n=1 Tax=Lysinibacillus alkalisoli TaxID=1911548 RepID=A0A917FX69_9BACI|nr:flagellar protein FlaG [Lysinibacillus alkalisoli]GGG13360.1 flagellar protein FlaG [Lysinibacillus alkalisoli]